MTHNRRDSTRREIGTSDVFIGNNWLQGERCVGVWVWERAMHVMASVPVGDVGVGVDVDVNRLQIGA